MGNYRNLHSYTICADQHEGSPDFCKVETQRLGNFTKKEIVYGLWIFCVSNTGGADRISTNLVFYFLLSGLAKKHTRRMDRSI